ncbi:MFS transporter [Nocardioides houyundeii]|uniref:MFS transporter n=1 Tax=Nocardioides houyundeii TaxID=2045452 RepID=UPI0013B35DBE|nr:MFS transporter [Nocardioides houyundeii]
MGGLVVSLTQTLVVPVLPTLPGTLQVSASTASWLVTITVVVAAACNPVLGRLGDQFGVRRMILLAQAMFITGSLVCALTTNISILILGRGLQGISTAAIPLSISLIARLLGPERRTSAIALVSAMLGIGGAIGLPLAGLISQAWGFHALFWVAAAIGVPTIAATRLLVPEVGSAEAPSPVDITGGALLLLSVTSLLVPLSRGTQWGWTAPETLGLFALGILSAALFVWLELRRRFPMVDIRLARQRTIALTNTASVLVGFGLFVSFLGTTAVLQAPRSTGYGFDMSVLEAGLYQLPGGLAMAFLSPVSARIIRSRGARDAMLLGTGILTVGFVARVLLDDTLWQVVGCALVIACGTAIAYAAMPSLILVATPAGQQAAATGLNALARLLGTSLGSAAFGALTVGSAVTDLPTGTAYTLFFALGAITSLLALVAVRAINPISPQA